MSKPLKNAKSPFVAIEAEAVKAADAAGDEWMKAAQARGPVIEVVHRKTRSNPTGVVGALLDECGIVYLKVRDKRTAFAKWLAAENDARKSASWKRARPPPCRSGPGTASRGWSCSAGWSDYRGRTGSTTVLRNLGFSPNTTSWATMSITWVGTAPGWWR